MKPAAIVLPIVSLLVAGIWLGSQHRSISALEQQSEVLKKRIAAHDAAPLTAGSASPGPPSREKTAETPLKEKIDWRGVAEQFGTMQRQGGMSDMRSAMRFQHQLQNMTTDELLAALDEVATLDLPKESLTMLEQMLLGPLAQKEPELALNRFIGRLDDDNGMMGWTLSSAMKEWSKKDATAAAAWLDNQIATGTFDSKSLDGKSRTRSMFEANLISGMLATDPAAAGARLTNMPETQRVDALSTVSQSLKEDQQAAYAAMTREHLPEDQQLVPLVRAGSQVAMRADYAEVSDYIERISATPEERAAIVKEAAGDKLRMISYNQKITTQDVDKMRDWALSNAANDANAITGRALARIAMQQGENNRFEDMAALAVQYHESTGNDDLMVSFLQNSNMPPNKDKSRELAEKISDPQRREEVLKRFK